VKERELKVKDFTMYAGSEPVMSMCGKLFVSNIPNNVYTVVVTCYRNGETWQEFWQLHRVRWTKRETKMIMADLHDKIITDGCSMVLAKVYYGEFANFEYYGELLIRFRTSRYNGVVRDIYTNVSGSYKRVIRWWARPYVVGIH
jgi:hypothetical protein